MSEVSAMCQVQTEDGVTRLEQGGHGGGVSLGARMGLNVGVLPRQTVPTLEMASCSMVSTCSHPP